MCSKNEDLPRFITFYELKIKEKVIKHYKVFDTSKKQVELMADEKVEAKAELNKLKTQKQKESGGMADLEKMILAKR